MVTKRWRPWAWLLFLAFVPTHMAGQQYVPEGLMSRANRAGDFEISVSNYGTLFNHNYINSPVDSKWPRGNEMIRFDYLSFGSGLIFGCKVDGRKVVTGSPIFLSPQYFPIAYKTKFVPGFMGDPEAGLDTAFGGVGWRYNNDPNYIVYSSLDYDVRGIDRSGSNFPDWPLRNVANHGVYVHNVLARSHYTPFYQADEVMFCIYKDTDTRVDPEYLGRYASPDSTSIPIGIEIRQSLLFWKEAPLKDVIVMQYDIHNKSDHVLDRSFIHLLTWPVIRRSRQSARDTLGYSFFFPEPSRSLGYVYNPGLAAGSASSPHLGIGLLEMPKDTNGNTIGMTRWSQEVTKANIAGPHTDVGRYDSMYATYRDTSRRAIVGLNVPIYWSTLAGSSGFRIQPGDSARFVVALMVGNGLSDLLRIHDLVRRVYANNYLVPQPPADPTLSCTPLDGAIRLAWDDGAERSTDPIVPDSLGKPFLGYRLYRARTIEGPYYRIKEWQKGRDSVMHEYLDNGTDGVDPTIPTGTTLLNNVSYFYKLTAYDEGTPSLGLQSMESKGKIIEARPGGGSRIAGDVSEIRIVPNPYIVSHHAQASIDQPVLYFNYLPEECIIRIYTVGLDLVRAIEHHGGPAATWDLRTEAGQQVASQMYIAHITTPEGKTAIRKFAVITGE